LLATTLWSLIKMNIETTIPLPEPRRAVPVFDDSPKPEITPAKPEKSEKSIEPEVRTEKTNTRNAKKTRSSHSQSN